MEAIKNKLFHLEILCDALGVTALNYLQRGSDEVSVSVFFKKHYNSAAPDEITSIYSWHNGTNTNSHVPVRTFFLFPGFILNSLESIDEILSADTFYEFKKNGFMPFFSSGSGEYLAVNVLQLLESSESAPVYWFGSWDPNGEMRSTAFDNISMLFQTIIRCYEDRIFFLDGKNLLSMNVENYFTLAKKFNPKSEYWVNTMD